MVFEKSNPITVNRRIIFDGYEKKMDECVQSFSGTRLAQIEYLIADALLSQDIQDRSSKISDDGGNTFKPFRKIRLKDFQFKQKFFHVFFRSSFLAVKPPSLTKSRSSSLSTMWSLPPGKRLSAVQSVNQLKIKRLKAI